MKEFSLGMSILTTLLFIVCVILKVLVFSFFTLESLKAVQAEVVVV